MVALTRERYEESVDGRQDVELGEAVEGRILAYRETRDDANHSIN